MAVTDGRTTWRLFDRRSRFSPFRAVALRSFATQTPSVQWPLNGAAPIAYRGCVIMFLWVLYSTLVLFKP